MRTIAWMPMAAPSLRSHRVLPELVFQARTVPSRLRLPVERSGRARVPSPFGPVTAAGDDHKQLGELTGQRNRTSRNFT